MEPARRSVVGMRSEARMSQHNHPENYFEHRLDMIVDTTTTFGPMDLNIH